MSAPCSKIKLTTEQINEICEDLRGTCGDLETAINDVLGLEIGGVEDIETDSLSEIDEAVFCCAVCGWWCETDEMAPGDGELTCTECAEETN